MKAMILAAGLGTRLRPLTNDRPKALVELGGRTLLEITLRRVHAFGIQEVIVNVHHFADLVVDYLKKNANFGMRVEISREEVLLDTGGGLKKAAWFFEEGSDAEPFLLHNVDVLSNIDFASMVKSHHENAALATLAVQRRETSRHLLFDNHDQLCGRQTGQSEPELIRHSATTHALAFSGLHVISPSFLSMMTEEGVFSIISSYLRVARDEQKIFGFRADGYYWRDLGKRENLAQAEGDIAAGRLQI
jgi:NDP-sugar pyrophosphorylase family protein